MQYKFPDISVIIPTFNRMHLLSDAVLSCTTQTYSNIEVIIVDDGSTDRTANVVAELIDSFPEHHIRYVHKLNGGVSSARQMGLKLARGRFIQFLDSDDTLMPRKFEFQLQRLLGFGDVDCCSCYGRKGLIETGWSACPRVGFCGKSAEDYARAMCSPMTMPMPTCAPLWRTEFLLRGPGWPIDLTNGEDWLYYTTLLLICRSVSFIGEDLFWVRDHAAPRLSNNEQDCFKPIQVTSFVTAFERLVRIVSCSQIFDIQTKKNLLNIARTTYFLILKTGDIGLIRRFESIIGALRSWRTSSSAIMFIIGMRRLFGTALTYRILDLALRLRR